jgi:hypothetical protein
VLACFVACDEAPWVEEGELPHAASVKVPTSTAEQMTTTLLITMHRSLAPARERGAASRRACAAGGLAGPGQAQPQVG